MFFFFLRNTHIAYTRVCGSKYTVHVVYPGLGYGYCNYKRTADVDDSGVGGGKCFTNTRPHGARAPFSRYLTRPAIKRIRYRRVQYVVQLSIGVRRRSGKDALDSRTPGYRRTVNYAYAQSFSIAQTAVPGYCNAFESRMGSSTVTAWERTTGRKGR